MFAGIIIAAVVGYVAAIVTWPGVRAWVSGLEAEILNLKARAQELEQRLRDKIGGH